MEHLRDWESEEDYRTSEPANHHCNTEYRLVITHIYAHTCIMLMNSCVYKPTLRVAATIENKIYHHLMPAHELVR